MKKLYKNTIDFVFMDNHCKEKHEQLTIICSNDFSKKNLSLDVNDANSLFFLLRSYLDIFDGFCLFAINSLVSEEVRYSKCLVLKEE